MADNHQRYLHVWRLHSFVYLEEICSRAPKSAFWVLKNCWRHKQPFLGHDGKLSHPCWKHQRTFRRHLWSATQHEKRQSPNIEWVTSRCSRGNRSYKAVAHAEGGRLSGGQRPLSAALKTCTRVFCPEKRRAGGTPCGNPWKNLQMNNQCRLRLSSWGSDWTRWRFVESAVNSNNKIHHSNKDYWSVMIGSDKYRAA